MLSGKIKMWNEDRGFGFISRDDKQPDAFVHISGFDPHCRDRIEVGVRVQFDMEQGRDGRLKATSVAY